MRSILPIDAHAHIDTKIDSSEMINLSAFVMSVTRSLDEADIATRRRDATAVWGVGCHPGLQRAQQSFNAGRFQELVARTPFVGELGLDGKSRVPMGRQVETMEKVLEVLQGSPRLTSLHSYAATGKLIELLGSSPPPGIILHWWLGDAKQTERAVEIGCRFSVNASSVRRRDIIRRIPRDRILTETDHPFGDRRSKLPRPGNVGDAELAIGREFGMTQREVRRLVWSNFRRLVSVTHCSAMLPNAVQEELAANP